MFRVNESRKFPLPSDNRRHCKDIEGNTNNSLYLAHNCYTYILYSKELEILLARTLVANRLFQILLTTGSCLLSQPRPGRPLTLTHTFTCTV